ncbi:MAG: metallophosphoesterase, partial [Candidatus Odinarchaeia archaeon]
MENTTKALDLLIKNGYQITPEAFDLLKKEGDPINTVSTIIKKISENKNAPIVLDKEFINTVLYKNKEVAVAEQKSETKIEISGYKKFKPLSKEYEPELKIIFDPTGKSYSTGKTEDFVNYFKDRYNRIKRIFLLRNDMNNLKSISELKPKNSGQTPDKIIAIVLEKRQTKNGNIYLELEDPTGTINGIINKNNKEVFLKAGKIIYDQVICFEGKTSTSNLFFINDFFWPDTSTQHEPKKAEIDLSVVMLSDIHIGSKEFMEKNFLKFIDWLNGKAGSEKQRELAGKVKYLVIAGDLVDGIGVYPKQEEDLIIKDIFEQYNKAKTLLELVPEYIQIIISPGNHDATPQAIPQPAIPKRYAQELYEMTNLKLIGNPAQIEFHGVNFLIYHGRSLDDLSAILPGA